MLLRLLSLIRSRLAAKPRVARPRPALLELLEDRISPATLINAHIVTYTDVDGDHVTIHSSKTLFTAGNVNNILTFNTGSVSTTGNGNGTDQQLQEINLTSLGAKVVAGDNLSITVVKAAGGDGLANVGFIDSSAALGHVLVQGDLGRIDAGAIETTNSHYVGLQSLTVHSLGAQGTSTQGSGGSLSSTIAGAVGSITIQQDMVGAQINVASNTSTNFQNGTIGSLKIGGNLDGAAGSGSGSITTTGNVGSILIGGDLAGGSGQGSGSLTVGGKIGILSVDNIIGYTLAGDTSALGAGSAAVVTGNTSPSVGGIGTLIVKGNVQGGDGDGSAEVSQSSVFGGSIGKVKIGGSITGGSGDNSAELTANRFGSISVGTGIVGGSGTNAGSIDTPNGIRSLSILAGGIVGGTGDASGAVISGSAPTGPAALGHVVVYGDITGNASAASGATQTGQIDASYITSLTLHGSLVGSTAGTSGAIVTQGSIGHVTLLAQGSSTGSIIGGSGSSSGEISAGTGIGAISIAGQVAGGSGDNSGQISAAYSIGSITIGKGIVGGVSGSATDTGVITTDGGAGYGGNLGSLKIIAGGITGGSDADSGQVAIGGAIRSVNLNGSIVAGGAGAASGSILATDNIGSVSIGAIESGAGTGSGVISTGGNLTSLKITGAGSSAADTGEIDVSGSAGAITIHGDLGSASSTTADAGLFLIGGGVKSFNVTGALLGGSGQDSGSIFAGLDDTSSIRSVSVGGGLIGGDGNGSAEVFGGGGITHATIADIIGGAGQASGSLASDGALGSIVVTGTAPNIATHGVVGGGGAGSGQISAGTTIQSVTVHGSVAGGSGTDSGVIVSNSVFGPTGDIQGNIGSITVTGSVTGGTAQDSGLISSAGNIKTISIGGSVTGTAYDNTGAILAGTDLTGITGGNITTLKITGGLIGGTGAAFSGSGYIEAGHIGSITVGSIQANGISGEAPVDGAILAANDIASLTVTGNITGANASDPVVISAVGQVTPPTKGADLAFGKISVGGNVTFTDFLAGYVQSGTADNVSGSISAVNGAASIGAVTVGKNWSGSNLVAGVLAGSNGDFGSLSDTLIDSSLVPTIASIIIKGQVVTSTGAADTYGLVAAKIEAFSLDGAAQSVSAGLINPVGQSTDTDLQDVL